jgi:DNA-binding MarR family transcriptional regulator
MKAMLREARKLGLSHWELRRVPDVGSAAGRMAQHIQQRRRVRATMFRHADLFGEPAWDIMLYLFSAQEEARPVHAADIFRAAHVPAEIGSRHLAQLERRGLVERMPVPGEEGIRLTDEALAAMRSYLDESWPD